MPTKIVSFGYKHGLPSLLTGDGRWDVRVYIPDNPYYVPWLRQLRGDHPEVITYIEYKNPSLNTNVAEIKATAGNWVTGILYLGCTGGHHRSVYLANRLGRELNVPVEHRDYDKK